MKSFRDSVLLLVLGALIGGSSLGAHGFPQPQSDDADEPMFMAHDSASEKMLALKTLNENDDCNNDFKVQLENIVRSMEEHKQDGTEDMADQLNSEFSQILEDNPNEKLCSDELQCIDSVCKSSKGARAARSLENGSTTPAGTPEDKPAEPEMKDGEKEMEGDHEHHEEHSGGIQTLPLTLVFYITGFLMSTVLIVY